MKDLPHIDIVIASYNSEKWIGNCIASIANLDYPIDLIKVIICDNNSKDNTIKLSEEHLAKHQISFTILDEKKNFGFGIANNKAASKGSAPFIFCMNYDTELVADSFMKWATYYQAHGDEKIGSYEFRQMPYEHPKLYNPATLDTSWNSAAAVMFNREAFESVNGFDPKIFMYCEDVDLSWRIRSKGYHLKYLHFCAIYHHSYTNHYGQSLKVVNSVIYNLLLRYRFGTSLTVLKGYLQLIMGFFNSTFGGSKKELFKKFIQHYRKVPYFLKTRVKIDKPQFYYWDFEMHKYGFDNLPESSKQNPLVSIIIRTHKRPKVLKEAIQSVLYQTYQNWEIWVAEDGGSEAHAVVDSFGDRRINYINSEVKVGRSKIGNLALAKAQGKLFNFLDDDDFLMNDHLETLVNHQELSNSDASYAIGLEALTSYSDANDASTYKIEEYRMPLFIEFSRFMMSTMNFLPIQTVLFKRELFDTYGGFDEGLEYLEDWDLWYRYSINTDFRFYPKATSIYKVPYAPDVKQSRQDLLDENYKQVRAKYAEKNKQYFGGIPEQHIDQSHAYYASRFSIVNFLQLKSRQASIGKKIFFLPLLYFLKLGSKLKP